MSRTGTFIFAFATLILVTGGASVENIDLNTTLVFSKSASKEDGKMCTVNDVKMFFHEYQNCFFDKTFNHGREVPEKLVSSVLAHSKICIETATHSCRPNMKGFIDMMNQVIYQAKDYLRYYLQHKDKERAKIKDLQCVEKDLLISTYQSCFNDTFADVADTLSNKFQLKVKSAVSCTNKFHKSCSRSAKTSLNRMVRQTLGVEQPEKEDIEEEVKQPKEPKRENKEKLKQPEPKKRWYDWILKPFVSIWRGIRSLFGF